jgi:hypothetical protein
MKANPICSLHGLESKLETMDGEVVCGGKCSICYHRTGQIKKGLSRLLLRRSCLAVKRRLAKQFCFLYGSVTYIKKEIKKFVTVKTKEH